MKLNVKKEILEDVISANITVVELGNSNTDADTELEMLHDFVKAIELSNIEFKSNIKLENGLPVLTSEDVDGTNVVELVIDNIINKKYIVNEELNIEFSIDTKKVAKSNLNDVLNTPELYGQAVTLLFVEMVKAAITEKLSEIRSLSNGFEDETDIIL